MTGVGYALVKVFLIGAGQVGTTIIEALHHNHELTVLDSEASRLNAVGERFDVRTYEGDGTSRKDLAGAGVESADLVIGCTSLDEVNLVAGMFARREAPGATTVIRTSKVEYVELWRAGQLDVDFVVSSELETAHAISRIIGVPAARQTDVFADGQVQVGEFDAEEGASPDVIGVPLRDAKIPADSKVAAIIRRDETILPGGDDAIRTGDRVVVIGSPQAAKAWSTLLWPEGGAVRDVVIFGAGRVGSAIARLLIDQGISIRMIEASARAGPPDIRGASEGARVSRNRVRARLPGARADRPVAGGDLRDAGRRQEPVRGLDRSGARDPVHDRDRA